MSGMFAVSKPPMLSTDGLREWSRGDDAGVDRAEPPADADDEGTASEALLGVDGSGGTLGCGRSWAVLEETTGAAVGASSP